MLGIDIICVGKLKEKFFSDACDEYKKRMGAYCKLNIVEVAETPASDPSEVSRALEKEAERIAAKIPKDACIICMCIEGKQMSSPDLSRKLEAVTSECGTLCFIIGSSHGLSPEVKAAAKMRLSVSELTFPHQLMRVILYEAVYRCYQIAKGSKYHK